MSPSANYRLDGTVTQYDARDKLVTHRDEPYAIGMRQTRASHSVPTYTQRHNAC